MLSRVCCSHELPIASTYWILSRGTIAGPMLLHEATQRENNKAVSFGRQCQRAPLNRLELCTRFVPLTNSCLWLAQKCSTYSPSLVICWLYYSVLSPSAFSHLPA